MERFHKLLKQRYSDALKALEKAEAQFRESQQAADAYRVALELEEQRTQKPGKVPGAKQKSPVPAAAVAQEVKPPIGHLSKTDLILYAITATGAAGVTITELENKLRSQSVKRTYIHTVIFKLKERGLVTKKGRDRYCAVNKVPTEEGQQQSLLQ